MHLRVYLLPAVKWLRVVSIWESFVISLAANWSQLRLRPGSLDFQIGPQSYLLYLVFVRWACRKRPLFIHAHNWIFIFSFLHFIFFLGHQLLLSSERILLQLFGNVNWQHFLIGGKIWGLIARLSPFYDAFLLLVGSLESSLRNVVSVLLEELKHRRILKNFKLFLIVVLFHQFLCLALEVFPQSLHSPLMLLQLVYQLFIYRFEGNRFENGCRGILFLVVEVSVEEGLLRWYQ